MNRITKRLFELQEELVSAGLTGAYSISLISSDFKKFCSDTGRIPNNHMVSIISTLGQIDAYDGDAFSLDVEPNTPLSYDQPHLPYKQNITCWDCYSGFCRTHKKK